MEQRACRWRVHSLNETTLWGGCVSEEQHASCGLKGGGGGRGGSRGGGRGSEWRPPTKSANCSSHQAMPTQAACSECTGGATQREGQAAAGSSWLLGMAERCYRHAALPCTNAQRAEGCQPHMAGLGAVWHLQQGLTRVLPLSLPPPPLPPPLPPTPLLPPLHPGCSCWGMPARVTLRRIEVAVELLKAPDPAIPRCMAKPCQRGTLSLSGLAVCLYTPLR